VRTISATARQISATNLGGRLRLDGPDDEFRELAATLDDLLARLEASFDSQRRFVANASHELRTPLTLDRALLERALRHPSPTHGLRRATCQRLLASSQDQDRLIDAPLTLARSEAGLSTELDAGHAGLRIQTEIGPAAVSGDPRLAERLVRNLVDNAIRYNQPAGLVNITTRTCSGRAVLAVSNTGPVVDHESYPRIAREVPELPARPHVAAEDVDCARFGVVPETDGIVLRCSLAVHGREPPEQNPGPHPQSQQEETHCLKRRSTRR
jgi:signal transduction histidine kinase